MADLEARREARRRKILENSGNRLSRITGVVRSPESQKQDTASRQVSLHQHHFDEPVQFDSILGNDDDEVFSSGLDEHFDTNRSPTNATSNLVGRMNHKNYHILLSGLFQGLLFVCLDLLQADVTALYLGHIFVPLMALEMIYYVLDVPVEPFPIIDMVLALCNVRSNVFVIYLNIVRRFVQIMQDVTLYFFVFVVTVQLGRVLGV